MGNFRIPKSSIIRSGTETSSSMHSLRVPSMVPSAQVIEQFVGFAIEHAITLLDRGLPDRLCEMTFTSTPVAGSDIGYARATLYKATSFAQARSASALL
jgi:hypothetical protein